jgi:hypothetical protein
VSSRTETIRIRTWPRLPRPGWLIPGVLAVLLAAGVGSYLALRSDAQKASPAVTQTAPGPARIEPARPLQPAAPPAGPQIAELRGVDAPAGATVARPGWDRPRPAQVKSGGADEPASEWRCSPVKRGPC